VIRNEEVDLNGACGTLEFLVGAEVLFKHTSLVAKKELPSPSRCS